MSRPYNRKASVDSNEVPIQGDEKSFSIEDTISGRAINEGGIVTEPVYSKQQLDDEAFMAQSVEVMLHEPGSENEPMFAEVTVNGMYRLVPRNGHTVTIPRMHLGVLCDAKVQRLVQVKGVSADGEMTHREVLKTNLSYPFSVVYDPAGAKGVAWLKQKLSAPA
jgi:hypothetical protein